MLRLVEPHDLMGRCAAVGKTLADLSERTGIPERELLLFSLGHLALKATDRFAILEELAGWSPLPRTASLHVVDRLSIDAYRQLRREVEQEDREENPE